MDREEFVEMILQSSEIDIPKYVLISLEEELPAFEQVVCGIEMPTVDMDACLQQIFDVVVIAEEEVFVRMLTNMAQYMGNGDGLYENARLDEFERNQIIYALIKIGTEIKGKLKELNMYIDGFIPYSFKKLVNRYTVILYLNEDVYLE